MLPASDSLSKTLESATTSERDCSVFDEGDISLCMTRRAQLSILRCSRFVKVAAFQSCSSVTFLTEKRRRRGTLEGASGAL